MLRRETRINEHEIGRESTMIRTISVSLALAFFTATAAIAAEPAVRATDYDNVHVRMGDPAKAAAWYVSALGATPSNPPAPGTAQVIFGGTVITITKGDSVQTSAGTLIDHIGLRRKPVNHPAKTFGSTYRVGLLSLRLPPAATRVRVAIGDRR